MSEPTIGHLFCHLHSPSLHSSVEQLHTATCSSSCSSEKASWRTAMVLWLGSIFTSLFKEKSILKEKDIVFPPTKNCRVGMLCSALDKNTHLSVYAVLKIFFRLLSKSDHIFLKWKICIRLLSTQPTSKRVWLLWKGPFGSSPPSEKAFWQHNKAGKIWSM